MIITNTPIADLALTNLAYCCLTDLHSFSVPGTKLALASVGDYFVLSISFVPPSDFDLALLSLELEFVKKGTKSEQIDVVLLAKQLRKKFINQGNA